MIKVMAAPPLSLRLQDMAAGRDVDPRIDGTVATPEQIERNVRYLRAAMADCLGREEAPIASHGLYTQPGVLDDSKREEREKGMLAGWAWHKRADAIVVYADLGITPGMKAGIAHAERMGAVIDTRLLGGEWEQSRSAA